MEADEVEVAVRVLQDSFSDLSREHARMREASAFLERRVQQLEQQLCKLAPPTAAAEDASPGGAQQDKGGAEAVKVGSLKEAPSTAEPPSDAKGIAISMEEEPTEELLAKDLDCECQEVALATSSWDACLLVGSPALGRWGSFATILCILVNSSIQIIFVAIVYANLVGAEFGEEELQGLVAWRLRVAHDERYKSPHGFSLASRVCGADPTLELSNEQAAKVDLIRKYSPYLDPDLDMSQTFSRDWMRYYFDGSVMCLLAVACWILTVSKEVGCVFDLLGAVAILPSGPGLGVHVAVSKDATEVVSAGFGSKALMLFVTGVRFSIAMLLLSFGALYVTYTSSIEDLLLNAVALECVLTVDELTFEALAPRRARQVLARLAPLKLPPWRSRRIRALDLKTMGLCTLLAVSMTVIWRIPLAQHTANLKAAHMAMCRGSLNFTVTVDGFYMIHAKSSRPFDGESEFASLTTPQDLAVKEVALGTPAQNWNFTLDPSGYGYSQLAPITTANRQELMTGIYGMRSGLGCHDAVDLTVDPALLAQFGPYIQHLIPGFEGQRRVWLNYLNWIAARAEGSSSSRTRCREFAHLCHDALILAFCPRTCSCQSLLGGRVGEDATGAGCPVACRSRVDWVEKRETSCQDAAHQNASDPKWLQLQRWAAELRGPLGEALANNSCRGLMADEGFPWLCSPPQWFPGSFTRTSYAATDPYVLKLMTFLCPETCNCGGRAPSSAAGLMRGVAPPPQSCPDSCR